MERSCGKTRVGDLPDECLALVFPRLHSKLDRDAAALTCRRWRALDALSRHSLSFSFDPPDPIDQWSKLHHHIPKLLFTFPHILSISVNVGFENGMLPEGFFTAFRHPRFSQLTTLHLFSCFEICDTLVSCLSLACPGLTDLCLSETGVTDAGLQFIARGCTHLVSLNLCSCDVTDAGIDVVLEGCSNMEKIFVSDIMGITGWGFRNGKRLTDIVAGECCLNNFAIEKITEGCQELKVLNVSWSENVTLAGWQVLAMSAAKLEILDVRGCECFCEGSLLAIQGGCPSLRYIKLLDDSFLPYPTFQQFQASRPNVQVEFS